MRIVRDQFGQAKHFERLNRTWRFEEIKAGQTSMSGADLDNTATNSGNFNEYDLTQLLDRLEAERRQTLALLEAFEVRAFQHQAVHPRLNQAMGILDLMHFVVEHDTHHFVAMQGNLNQYYEMQMDRQQ